MRCTKNVCRFCGTELKHTFLDLGMSPLANSYLSTGQLQEMEAFYPLHAYVCETCHLVQLMEYRCPNEIFRDYAYFSSYSQSWLEHAMGYAKCMIERFGFDSNSHVVEIGSNDGYLLQYFKARNIPVTGIEPAANVARASIELGIPTINKFFDSQTALELATEGKHADLLIGNNVLAHVPKLHDFVKGLKTILKSDGVLTMEFPHLMSLIDNKQFDTIYHEHFSYFSFLTVSQVFRKNGLTIFDVEKLETHGGSLRIYACHIENNKRNIEKSVQDLISKEVEGGYDSLPRYLSFDNIVKALKRDILRFMIGVKSDGKNIVGYGAPAKGNTLLNYCGIRTDFIDYTVDRSPHKQGLFLPGTHIPICHPEKIKESKPDYVVIIAWNLRDEIMDQMSFVRDWGGKFVTLIPEVRTYQ